MNAPFTCDELIEQFEALQFPAGEFHHEQHIQLGFGYLLRHELLDALQHFKTSLKRFAVHHGAKGLYHETITMAFLILIHDRLQRSGIREWDEFRVRHSDLFAWKPSILERYYQPATLASDLARRTLLWPDLRS